jgi:hypothetical protein
VVEKHLDEPLHLLQVRLPFITAGSPLIGIQKWEDRFFQSRTTCNLGLRYQIGHPFGEDCPFNYLGQSRTFVVLHNNGIPTLDVDFCSCSGAPSEVDQLLNVGWYPATHKDPSTAATVSLLRRFHKLNLQARLPAYDFYNTLVLLTNATHSKTVPVSFSFGRMWYITDVISESATTVYEYGAGVSPPPNVQTRWPWT